MLIMDASQYYPGSGDDNYSEYFNATGHNRSIGGDTNNNVANDGFNAHQQMFQDNDDDLDDQKPPPTTGSTGDFMQASSSSSGAYYGGPPPGFTGGVNNKIYSQSLGSSSTSSQQQAPPNNQYGYYNRNYSGFTYPGPQELSPVNYPYYPQWFRSNFPMKTEHVVNLLNRYLFFFSYIVLLSSLFFECVCVCVFCDCQTSF